MNDIVSLDKFLGEIFSRLTLFIIKHLVDQITFRKLGLRDGTFFYNSKETEQDFPELKHLSKNNCFEVQCPLPPSKFWL